MIERIGHGPVSSSTFCFVHGFVRLYNQIIRVPSFIRYLSGYSHADGHSASAVTDDSGACPVAYGISDFSASA